MRAPSVKPQYGPTLSELLVPRWRSASIGLRGLVGAGVVVLVVVAVAAAILLPRSSTYVHRGSPVAFNLSYPRTLRPVRTPRGAYMRIEGTTSSGRLRDWFEVDPLTLGPYSGEISGQLPVFATGYIARLERTVPDFQLQTETKTRVNLVVGYTITYSGRFGGQLMYGRVVLLVGGLTGVRTGVIMSMGIRPSASLDDSPDQVGSADVLQKPFRSFRFGA